jgi:hypothetical protein
MRNREFRSQLLPGEIEKQMLDELFEGISVSDAMRANALKMMQADSEERSVLVSHTRDANLDEQNAMMRRRDAGIRALLESAEDRECFDANAAHAELRRTGDDPPSPPACAR